ncbi:hypothetical protein ACTXT7_015059 [Hymenolepis weldensis]
MPFKGLQNFFMGKTPLEIVSKYRHVDPILVVKATNDEEVTCSSGISSSLVSPQERMRRLNVSYS